MGQAEPYPLSTLFLSVLSTLLRREAVSILEVILSGVNQAGTHMVKVGP
jgi:hypothetical protein